MNQDFLIASINIRFSLKKNANEIFYYSTIYYDLLLTLYTNNYKSFLVTLSHTGE